MFATMLGLFVFIPVYCIPRSCCICFFLHISFCSCHDSLSKWYWCCLIETRRIQLVENRAVIYMCVWCINCLFAIFLLYFGTVPRVWYFFNCPDSVIFFELFRQCDIFLTVQAVWYFLNCSDSVIFVALFRQCDICCLSFYPSPGTYSALLRSVQ
jgi:hypothetical protein